MLNHSASLAIQQVFSKPCLLDLISKDTRLVFSIYVISVVIFRVGQIDKPLKNFATFSPIFDKNKV